MNNHSESAGATRRVKTTRRYWRRTDTTKPWWPWGLVPVLGLALLFLFGALFMAPRIEAQVRDQVSERLDHSGLTATDVISDGQGVTIEAAASADEELHIEALAKSTQCDTWAGQLTCPTTIRVHRNEPEAAPALLKRRPHPFTVERAGNAVTLTGEVPSLEERDRILNRAGQHFDVVTDALSVSNESAGTNYGHAADQALAVVSHLTSGRASWSGDALAVDGVANAGAVANAREQFGAIGSESLQGEFNVGSLLDRQQCNTDFGAILTNASIRFQTGSAAIDAGNDELLAQLAELARSCPGNLTIEGHTDSQGDADMNKALSLARATAVRDALAALGIAADRVTAMGFGESRPVADNATSAGRAKNRRIAITIDEQN